MGHIQLSSSVIITTAGRLLCKAVIHTVGPKMGKGDKDTKLRKPIRSSLTFVSAKKLKSISTPGISSGIFGFS
jgi:O-acetyl-ADP-ribose deacetylase (regulator of RNase III)